MHRPRTTALVPTGVAPRQQQQQGRPALGGQQAPYSARPQRRMAVDPTHSPPPSGADVRRAMGGANFERKLAILNERLNGHDQRFDDLIKIVDNPVARGLNPGGLGQLGEDVQRAVYTGRCLPYNAVVDIFIPKGTQGEARSGQIFVTQDGPIFISRVLSYARIWEGDAAAANFPATLIDAPLCTDSLTPDAIALNNGAVFTLNPANLLPTLDVGGMFIPMSPQHCKLVCCGSEVMCGTLQCEGQPDTSFNVKQPLAILDHPECFDGLIEISTNDCGWQSVAYPTAMLEDAMFDLTNESPDCIGVCSYVDCNKVVQVIITPTRKLKYDVNVSIVLAGFRVLTCGGPACSTG